MVASWQPFGSPGLRVINFRQRLLINVREREHWDAHFRDNLNATQTTCEEIRSVVLYIDTPWWAIREKLGIEFPVQPPTHRSKVQ